MNKPPVRFTESGRRPVFVIFFTLVLELAGFSIIFPLFPAMLDYYLPLSGDGGDTLLANWIALLQAIQPGEPSPWMTAVLFGGTLASLYGILQFLTAPFLGRLSDQHGRRKILLLTLAGTALSYLIWIFSGSFLWLVVSRLIGGAMAGNIAVATAAMADITSAEKRSRGMALVGVAFGLGFICGPLIGGASAQINLVQMFPVLSEYGLHPFSVAALASLCLTLGNLLWVWKRFPETVQNQQVKGAAEATPPPRRWGRGDTPAIDRVNFVGFLFILAISGLEFTLTFLAVERFGFTPWQNGLLFLYIGVLLIAVQGGIVRRIGPRLGERLLARAGLFASVTALLLMAFSESLPGLLWALLFLSLGLGFTNPALSALVSRYADPRRQGYNLGLFRALTSLGRAVGPLIGGVSYFLFGAATAYLLAGLFMLLPLALAWKLPKP